MTYVALLRGINVGGKNKVDMKLLKQTFGRLGLSDISTYINSGNVLFTSSTEDEAKLTGQLAAAIEQDFGFAVPVVLRSHDQIEAVVKSIPPSWANDDIMKCDVMFLWPEIDSPDILKQVVHKPELEDVLYLPGALVWRIDRANVNRGGLLKIVGSEPYKKMTIRNVNTTRKLLELMAG